jgi:hypothetical protein
MRVARSKLMLRMLQRFPDKNSQTILDHTMLKKRLPKMKGRPKTIKAKNPTIPFINERIILVTSFDNISNHGQNGFRGVPWCSPPLVGIPPSRSVLL